MQTTREGGAPAEPLSYALLFGSAGASPFAFTPFFTRSVVSREIDWDVGLARLVKGLRGSRLKLE